MAALSTNTAKAVPPSSLLQEDVVAVLRFLGLDGGHVQVIPRGAGNLVLQVGELGIVLVLEIQAIVGVCLVVALEDLELIIRQVVRG